MQLYFVRHGESEANLLREFSNRGSKHPLTPRGVAQAHALAERLAGQPVSQIFSSPLQRAVQTAEILAQALGAPLTVTDALREWDVGIYEGTTDPRGWELHYEVQQAWYIHRRWDDRMPGGESFRDIAARFVPFVDWLTRTADHADATAVLVSHGGLYQAMLPHVFANVDYAFMAQHPFPNTGYAVAETGPGGLVCREWCGVAIDEVRSSSPTASHRAAHSGIAGSRESVPAATRERQERTMELVVRDVGGQRFLEGIPGQRIVEGAEQIATLIEACFGSGVDRVLLYPENLSERFFDLSSGEAGAILQKLRTYRIRLGIVRTPAARLSSRFAELLSDEREGSDFRLFDERDAAERWLCAP